MKKSTPQKTTPTKTKSVKKSNPEWISKDDVYLFNEGNHFKLYEHLGAHITKQGRTKGTHFAVWAPNANYVSVVGNFNGWNKDSHPMSPQDSSGIWVLFIPGVGEGEVYKYHISSAKHHYLVDKADPFAFFAEQPPKTGSIISSLEYSWEDDTWMKGRKEKQTLSSPMSIYEVHLGSWKRVPEDNYRSLNYREMAHDLAQYVSEMGYTHVELLPIMEHPFDPSWGYQCTSYFAPTSRFGKPQDFMYLIDHLHKNGIGVILDWVPSHFPTDQHGLGYFDGTALYEHEDPKQGFHPDWTSNIFNYGRHEVRSFLISSALFWLEKYHIDGIRVDAVASMLYLDYSRKDGEWVPNIYGGNENLEGIYFLRKLNEEVYKAHPDVQMIAEESTAWPMVSKPTSIGGLGFGLKWDMGWMHDTLRFFSKESIHRKYHHQDLTFRQLYAWHENFVLPLSHDEVVHGKGGLLQKMAGDEWQRFANLRLLFGSMYAQPGKKLLFMGADIGQGNEWNHASSIEWHLLDFPFHQGIQRWLKDLNHLYKNEPALHVHDCHSHGFEWVDCSDSDQSIISLIRKGQNEDDMILVVGNFTPVPRYQYRIGSPLSGYWREILNSDAQDYQGSGVGNLGWVEATHESCHGKEYSLELTLPPLGILFMKFEPGDL